MSWYFHRELKPLGPFSLEEIRLKISHGEIGPEDLVFNQEADQWKSAREWRVFESDLFPANQLQKGEEPLPAEWVVLTSVQEGPYSEAEIAFKLQSGELSEFHHAWKPGLSGWVQIKDRSEWSNLKSRSADL